MNKQTIDEIKTKAMPILKQSHVTKAALFGSYVRGEQTEESDIDFVVDLPKHATLIDLVGLKLELEEALHRKVDVVEYAGLKTRIKDSILSQQIPIL